MIISLSGLFFSQYGKNQLTSAQLFVVVVYISRAVFVVVTLMLTRDFKVQPTEPNSKPCWTK
jgi:Na+/H+-dicarboxylate symporter